MCNILVIAPYEGLKDLFLEVNKQLKENIDVYVGDLYDGLAIAKSLEHRGYDVVISRGATAKLLKKHMSIPVVEIPMTGYDILRTLTLLNGFSGKIGMMSYLNNIPGAHTIGNLLNMDITFYPIDEENEVEKEIQKAADDGVQVIIGDVISTKTAAKFGIQTILITSGKEAVTETIANVKQLIHYVQKEKRQMQRLFKLFEQMEEGIFIFTNEECTYKNDRAHRFIRFFGNFNEKEKLTWSQLKSFIPNMTSFNEVEFMFQNEAYLARMFPLAEDKFLLRIKNKKRIHVNDQHERSAYFHFNSFVARSEKMTQLIQIAKKVSRSDAPIFIFGERGVGKESLAQAIHNYSERKERPYVYVNGDSYSESQLEKELFQLVEWASGGTLFIDEISELPLTHQTKLLQFMTEHADANVRFIASLTKPLDNLVDQHRIALSPFSINVPPLRERLEDLDDLVRLFIASTNASTKKQISGLRPFVLKELRSLKWYGNIDQLKWTIEQMCKLSSGPFIEYEDVKELLQSLKKREKEELCQTITITGKTLQQIENEVIMSVLKQEHYNQSQAARKLGINRSTLWRKIKQIENC